MRITVILVKKFMLYVVYLIILLFSYTLWLILLLYMICESSQIIFLSNGIQMKLVEKNYYLYFLASIDTKCCKIKVQVNFASFFVNNTC